MIFFYLVWYDQLDGETEQKLSNMVFSLNTFFDILY